MRWKERALFSRGFILVLCLMGGGTQGGVIFGAEPPLSRDMQLGIFYFKKEEYSQAMDRFVEALNHGNPAERELANRYLNRITNRMALGEAPAPQKNVVYPAVAPQTPKVLAPNKKGVPPAHSEPEQKSVPVSPDQEELMPAPISVPSVSSAPMKTAAVQENPTLIKEQIEEKIKAMARSGLRHLSEARGIVIEKRKDGSPLAIAIPTKTLFQSKIAFRPGAEKIVAGLSSSIYGEGKAKILIFPEGAALGDAKVMDMRRAVAVSDSLVASGISPVRIQAALLTGSSYRIPEDLLSFKGIVFLFVYGQNFDLKAPLDEAGPPLSLGVSSPRFRVDHGGGTLIEFSVEKPASGVRFWKFKILNPQKNPIETLEEVVGNGPVFHQVYWNGRKNYSGPHQPYGFYECLLTAEDGSGRARAVHRWIALEGPHDASVKAGNAEAKSSRTLTSRPLTSKRKIISNELTAKKMSASVSRVEKSFNGRKRVVYVELRSGNKKRVAKKSRKRAAQKKNSRDMSPEFLFKSGSYQLTPSAKKAVLLTARRMAKDRKVRYDIIGYARSSEKNAKSLCRLRAQVVAGLLINKYRISLKRLRVRSKTSALARPSVVIKKRIATKKRRRH